MWVRASLGLRQVLSIGDGSRGFGSLFHGLCVHIPAKHCPGPTSSHKTDTYTRWQNGPKRQPFMITGWFSQTTRRNKRPLSVMGRPRARKGLEPRGSHSASFQQVSSGETSDEPCRNQEIGLTSSTLRLMAEQDTWSLGPSTFLIRKANWINRTQD